MSILFFRIPKTGSTSIAEVLVDYYSFSKVSIKQNKFRNKHENIIVDHTYVPDLVNAGFVDGEYLNTLEHVFCFVRNPYTRTVSLFKYLYGKEHTTKSFRRFLRLLQNEMPPIGPYNVKGLSQCNAQSRWLFRDNIIVGRFEEIESDFRRIMKQLIPNANHDFIMPHERNSHIEDYDKYYDTQTISMVNELYKEDFDRFGYQRKSQ